jgi:hypothetical protein
MTLLPLCLLPPPSRTGKSGAKLLSITSMEEELDPKPPATAGARVGGGGGSTQSPPPRARAGEVNPERHGHAWASSNPAAVGDPAAVG